MRVFLILKSSIPQHCWTYNHWLFYPPKIIHRCHFIADHDLWGLSKDYHIDKKSDSLINDPSSTPYFLKSWNHSTSFTIFHFICLFPVLFSSFVTLFLSSCNRCYHSFLSPPNILYSFCTKRTSFRVLKWLFVFLLTLLFAHLFCWFIFTFIYFVQKYTLFYLLHIISTILAPPCPP